MSSMADILERAEAENRDADMRRNREVKGQRVRELEALLAECLDDARGVNCHTLYKKIAKALGRRS